MKLVNKFHYKVKRVFESPLSFLFRKLVIIGRSIFARPFIFAGVHKVYRLCWKNKLRSALNKSSSHLDLQSFLLSKPAALVLTSRVKSLLNEHEYDCLGYGKTIIGGNSWLADDVHDASWAADYFTKIDIVDAGRVSDIKIVWEKSRLQFLPEIALLVLNSSSDSQRKELVSDFLVVLKDWHAHNPFGYGPNWVVSMEAAIRAANIMFSYLMLLPYLSDDDQSFILGILCDHYLFLLWFPEISDVEGNHSLATQMGLALFGMHLSKTPDESVEEFINYAEAQFPDSGMHLEYAPTYHRLCVEMVSVVLLAGNLSRINLPNQLSVFLAKLFSVCEMISIEKSLLPLFGDNDSGHVFNFGQSERDISYLFNSLLEERYICRSEAALVAQVFWKGFLGGHRLQSDYPIKIADNYVLPYAKLEHMEAKAIMRVGPLGLNGRASHDHDDNLSFVLSLFDREIITDTGCPPYTLDSTTREKAIVSLAHNVVQVKGEPRNRLAEGSIFKTISGARVADLIYVLDNEVSAEISCPMKDRSSLLQHRRTIRLSSIDNSLIMNLVDKVVCSKELTTSHRLHFTKKVELSSGDGFVVGKAEGVMFQINFTVEPEASVSFNIGSYELYEAYGSSSQALFLDIEIVGPESYTLSLKVAAEKT